MQHPRETFACTVGQDKKVRARTGPVLVLARQVLRSSGGFPGAVLCTCRLPGVQLRSLDVPGHIGFFACQPAWQKQLLAEMLAASCSDNPAATGCAGWAAAGGLSMTRQFCPVSYSVDPAAAGRPISA